MSISEALRRFAGWVEGEETEKPLKPAPSDMPAAAPEKKKKPRAALSKKERERRLLRERRDAEALYRLAAALVCAAMIAVLVITVSWLPPFGSSTNPEENEVYERYVQSGLEEAGAVNTVADMILDYRAFDTLGESNVLFIAVCSVMILLRAEKSKHGEGYNIPELKDPPHDEPGDLILQAAARVLVPVGLLFGIYVILNGHLSAGGGFSGGAVIGGCMVLYVNAFGPERLEKYFTLRSYQVITFISLITYTLLKTYSFYTGANSLESGIPLGTPGAILSGGLILPLNICVGLVVACTMYAFYALFAKGGFGNGR